MLHNWWDETSVVDDPGTVEYNANHALECLTHDDGSGKTLPKLFHTVGSQILFKKGLCLPCNAIWGAPTKGAIWVAPTEEGKKIEEGKKREYLPFEVYVDFMDVWVWLANELKIQCIYLLGDWAAWPALLKALSERTTIGYKLLRHPGGRSWRGIVLVDELIATLMNGNV